MVTKFKRHCLDQGTRPQPVAFALNNVSLARGLAPGAGSYTLTLIFEYCQ